MQYLNALATLLGSSGVGIVTALGIDYFVPLVGVTCGSGLLYALRLIDSQVQCNDTITTIGSSCGINIFATCCVCLAIPSITITCSNSLLSVLNRINRQIQDMLYTINIGSCVLLCIGVFTSDSIRLTIPYIRCFCLTDSNTLFLEVASCKYCQIQ